MSSPSSRRQLWLPVVALLVIGGAIAFALVYDWTPPRPAIESAERDSRDETLGVRGEIAPLSDDTVGRQDHPDSAKPTEESAPPIEMKAPDGVEPLEGEGVVGILVDAAGNPVSRASVSCSRDRTDLTRSGGAGNLSSFKIEAGNLVLGRQSGVTDRSGRFAVRNPGKDGKYSISFSHEDHPRHTVDGVAWKAGSRIDLGVVRIPAGGKILGFVRGEDGKPISGARVWRTRKAEDGGGPGHRVHAFSAISISMSGGSGGQLVSLGGNRGEMTDAEGYFEMTRVPPGTYSLHASARGTAEAVRDDLVVREGGETGPIQLTMSKGLEISGTVVDETGQVLPGATVMARPSGAGNPVTARANGQGAFTFQGLRAGAYSLSILGRGFSSGGGGTAQSVEAGSSGVRLVLKTGLTLAGRLVDAATGSPVGSARVILVQRGPDGVESRQVRMAMNGAFRYPRLQPGDYTLEFMARGYRKATEGPVTLVEGRSVQDLLIRLQPE